MVRRLAPLAVSLAVTLLFTGYFAFHRTDAPAPAHPRPALQPVRGTRVSIAPPEGFVPDTNFPGFSRRAYAATIQVTEMPAPFHETRSGFNLPELRERGMTLLDREDLRIGGYPGFLVHLTQVAAGQTFEKWIGVLGNEQESLLVVATFPRASAESFSAPMKAAILSTRWDLKKSVDPLADLNYAVEPAGPLKLARRLGNGLLYTRRGAFPAQDPADPLFIVGPSISRREVPEARTFAEHRAHQTESLDDLAIARSEAVEIDGLTGWEILGEGKDRRDGRRITLYQVVLLDGPTYYLMQGLVGTAVATDHLSHFQAMARSFKRKP